MKKLEGLSWSREKFFSNQQSDLNTQSDWNTAVCFRTGARIPGSRFFCFKLSDTIIQMEPKPPPSPRGRQEASHCTDQEMEAPAGEVTFDRSHS